eukprot:7453539-Ditylum_brightwellii.AAC.1
MKSYHNCITEFESHVQNNKVIHSNVDEKLDKAILNTKQVAMDLSKACNKATSLQCQASDSRFDNIDKTLHDHDEEIQKLMNK